MATSCSRWDSRRRPQPFQDHGSRPDGTNMFIRYGAHSEGNSFHPREMDTTGGLLQVRLPGVRPDAAVGQCMRAGHWSVDAANFSEQDTRPRAVKATSGQSYPTEKALEFQRGLSRQGPHHHAPIRCGTATACCLVCAPARSTSAPPVLRPTSSRPAPTSARPSEGAGRR